MTHSLIWRALAAITLTVSASAYPHQTYPNIVPRAGCPIPDICTWGSCTNTTIGLDPRNCGKFGNSCEPSEICVAGQCLPLDLGTYDCPTDCKPGQLCNNGECVSIEIAVDPLHCGGESCNSSSLCINQQCQKLDIGSDPASCGPSNTKCDAGSWCLYDTCIPFILGTNVQACDERTSCSLGTSCEDGYCRQIFLSTDINNCGEDSKACTAGQVCVSGQCQSLDDEDADQNCDTPCEPGSWCMSGECIPISISTDTSQCGSSTEPCGKGQVCVSGHCISNLAHRESIPKTACSPSTRLGGFLFGPGGSSDQNNNGGGREGSPNDATSGQGGDQQGGYSTSNSNGSGSSPDETSGGGGQTQGGQGGYPGGFPGSRPGSNSGSGNNQGGPDNFGAGRPGPGEDGNGFPSSACEPECASSFICVSGECLSVSDPLSCGPSTNPNRLFHRQNAVCPPGYACIDDRCVRVDGPSSCGGSICPANYACIQEACVPLGDPTDCGAGTATRSGAGNLPGSTASSADASDDAPIVNPGPGTTGTDGLSASTTSIRGGPDGNGGSTTSGDGGGDSPTETDAATSDAGPIVGPGSDSTDLSGASTRVTGGAEGGGGSEITLSGTALPTDTSGESPTDGDDDCLLNVALCVFNGLNICTCVDGVCTQQPGGPEGSGVTGSDLGTSTAGNGEPTDSAGSTITDGAGETATTTGDPAATSAVSCSADDDCLANAVFCSDGLLNLCICVDGICILDPALASTTDVNNGQTTTVQDATTTVAEAAATSSAVACTTDADCLADLGLCVDGLINLCICVDAICIVDPALATTSGLDNGQTTTDAGATTTEESAAATSSAVACTSDDDCLVDVGLCVDGLLNLCVCVDAVCILDPALATTTADATGTATQPAPTETTTVACSTADDCAVNVDLCIIGGLNLCVCLNGVCVADPDGPETTAANPTATNTGPGATSTAVACSTADDCAVDADLCLDGLINLCVCLNAVCVNPGGGNDQTTTETGAGGGPTTAPVACTTADDCVADADLCLDGLLNLCVCLNAVCVNPGGGNDQTTTETGAGGGPTTAPVACSTADDCVADADLCLDGLLNLCVCLNAVCVVANPGGDPTETTDLPPENTRTPCATNGDCTANAALCLDGLLNICVCLEGLCIVNPVVNPTQTTAPAPTETATTSCNTADDCTANAGLCLDGLLNLCLCVNAVCVPSPGGGGNNGDPCTGDSDCTAAGAICLDSGVCGPDPGNTPTSCTTADDCTANAALCLDGLLNLCVCLNAVCVQAGGGGGGNTGDACTGNADCTTAGDVCTNGVCTAAGGGGTDACVDANDCLLSVNPLCALGLCVCVDAVCTTSPDVDECTSNAGCSAGATCQNGVCVDNTDCTGAADCLANLDICVLPGVCACVNGVCGLVGNGPTPECTAAADCRTLPRCRLGLCLCVAGQCVLG
ncbi:hypothetical protein FPRO05_02845 [Fusarium proliferatum]|uniref:EGF-like domain-containing protein n=1 Tax=Gibberella intermedia TaxID=948311 RepID=A0A365MZT3_GIBIN|nr:hypothetical protein FPRO05_02845 [Fusarium proliferatum]